MRRIKYLFFTALVILALGCNNKSDFIATYKGNIEGESDWINNNTIGKFGGATGDYCSKVDSINEFSYGFCKLISKISPYPIKKVKVSVSIKLENLSKKSNLVISLTDKNNKNIFYSGRELNTVVLETNKWYKFNAEDVLPDFDTEGANIMVYVWNPNKNVAYVDDFEISFLEK
ncbi:MAG: hypothetical protein WC599_09505 [Bacteroidales bacterium]